MKIIGKGANGDYIANVSHTELEKFLNQYYGKLDRLSIGEDVDLGLGYDFKSDIERALNKTQDFIEGNGKIITAILNGIQIVKFNENEKTAAPRKE